MILVSDSFVRLTSSLIYSNNSLRYFFGEYGSSSIKVPTHLIYPSSALPNNSLDSQQFPTTISSSMPDDIPPTSWPPVDNPCQPLGRDTDSAAVSGEHRSPIPFI